MFMVQNVDSDTVSIPNNASNQGSRSKLLNLRNEFKLCKTYYARNWLVFVVVQCPAFILGMLFFQEMLSNIPSIFDFVDFDEFVAIEIMGFICTTCVIYFLLGISFIISQTIFSSGDEIAKLKRSLLDFKAHWWQYLEISLMIAGLFFLVDLVVDFTYRATVIVTPFTGNLWWFNTLIILSTFFRWLVFVFVITLYPSVTAQGSLRRAIVENLSIIKHHFVRLIEILSLGYVFSFLLWFVIEWGVWLVFIALGVGWYPFPGEVLQIIYLFSSSSFQYLIVLPIITLMVTRVYNTKFIKRGGAEH